VKSIGPETAEHIISYRKSAGCFRSVDELINVHGIGPKTVMRLREHVKADASRCSRSTPDGFGRSPGGTSRTYSAAPRSSRININAASASELEKLHGVGPVTAEKIISYRQKHGSFRRPEDIQNVLGIGPVTYAKMKDQITVR